MYALSYDRKYILASYSSQPSKSKTISIREMSLLEYDPTDSQLILKMPNIRIVCECCLKNITLVCHIASEDYDYCLGCFCQLQEVPEVYSVRSTLIYSLTEPNWLCLDQILLLTAFQIWGFGNWGEVKDYMNFNGSKFNKNQIQAHYDHYYLETQDLNPRVSEDVMEMTKSMFGREAKRFNRASDNKNERKSMLELKSQQAISSAKKITGPQQNVLGYNSKRKCFYYDLEYDEKAECMLADMEFKDDDTPSQIELKLQIIEAYNRRLDQRLKRYQFTIAHHLLDIDYRFKQEFSADKYQKEAFMLFRPFTRFQSHAENMETMQLIAKNSYYKSLIQGLKQCRKKIDKEGKIETTLKYLSSKQDEIDKLGHPRKVYRLNLQKPIEQSKQLIDKMQDEICKNSEVQPHTSLKIIYRSNPSE